MKKGILLIATAILMSVNFAFANTTSDEEKESNVKKAIKQEVVYPEFAIEEKLEGEVLVSFTVNKDGKIDVLRTNSVYKELEGYVIEKMKTMTVNADDAEIGKTYNMKISFKLL
jgi:TonB family protein